MEWLAQAGAARSGVAEAEDVMAGHREIYRNWIANGLNGPLGYMERYRLERTHPRYLLPGVRSVVSCAFPYYYPIERDAYALSIARYALGDDYHQVVRRRLEAVAEKIMERYGGECRVCVDTAPLPERYWAERAGVGFTGRNGQLYVAGLGSYFFLGEILTTVQFEPTGALDGELGVQCLGCGRCVKACPSGALRGDGSVDARKCHSCLSIEYRGELPGGYRPGRKVYGCDVCSEVCPLNKRPMVSGIEELRPRRELLGLTREKILAMTHEEYCDILRNSAIRRAKLAQLKRNAEAVDLQLVKK